MGTTRARIYICALVGRHSGVLGYVKVKARCEEYAMTAAAEYAREYGLQIATPRLLSDVIELDDAR